MNSLCKQKKKNTDWFEEEITEVEPEISAKPKNLLEYKRDTFKKTLAALRKADNDAQRTARRCANNSWLNLCNCIQLFADCRNAHGMNEGIKEGILTKCSQDSTIKVYLRRCHHRSRKTK